MATYEDLIADILYEATNRPRYRSKRWLRPCAKSWGMRSSWKTRCQRRSARRGS
jgi:hypothetical protein